jgi:hypothetical protein
MVSWVADALAGSGINATSAQINYLPRFNDTSGNLVNSDIYLMVVAMSVLD